MRSNTVLGVEGDQNMVLVKRQASDEEGRHVDTGL